MDRLAEKHGGGAPWPSFDVRISDMARAMGCQAVRIDDHAAMLRVLDDVLPRLAGREEPLLIEVAVTPDTTFEP